MKKEIFVTLQLWPLRSGSSLSWAWVLTSSRFRDGHFDGRLCIARLSRHARTLTRWPRLSFSYDLSSSFTDDLACVVAIAHIAWLLRRKACSDSSLDCIAQASGSYFNTNCHCWLPSVPALLSSWWQTLALCDEEMSEINRSRSAYRGKFAGLKTT